MVGRELLLAGHLEDRASVPALLRTRSMEEANQLAIEEWMTTSPVYTGRMQRLLGFEGTDVGTIFKGLQLEIGMPHQFLDAGFELHDDSHGEFWLRSCGALNDVRPMGHEMVRGMCVDIEDPTFDATAAATNPTARMRPIHRPPEVPHGGPACHWSVTIDEDRAPVAHHPNLAAVAGSRLAATPNEVGPSSEPGGWDDYRRPFDPQFELEDLSQGALAAVCYEFAIQGHLLARAMMMAIDRRHGREAAIDIGRATFTGIGWVAAERMAAALRSGHEAPALGRVLPLVHLLLPTDYLGLTITDPAPEVARIDLDPDAPALEEGDPYSVAGLLDLGADEIIESIACGIDPRAQVQAERTARTASWTITVDPDAEPRPEPATVSMVRYSTGPGTVFIRRRPLRQRAPSRTPIPSGDELLTVEPS